MASPTPTPDITDHHTALDLDPKHQLDFHELVPAGDEEEDGDQAPVPPRSSGGLKSRRKSFSASILISKLSAQEKNKKEEAGRDKFDMKETVTDLTRRGLIFLRGLGLGWSLGMLLLIHPSHYRMHILTKYLVM